MKHILGLFLLSLLALPAFGQTPTTPAIAAMVCANNTIVPTPVNGKFFYVQCDSNGKLITTGGSGTVTIVSVTTANGISGTVATATTTPAISLVLGAITPSSVAIGAGSAITSSGAGGALGTGAFASAYTLPTATNSVLGGVKPDGTTITNTAGVISVTNAITALPVSVAQGGTGDTGTPWTSYTPTVTCSTSGAITTDSIGARYKTLGKTVWIQINVNITTLGTCLGNLSVTAPVAGQGNLIQTLSAENHTTGLTVAAEIFSNITVFFTTAPAANYYIVGGTYESN